MHCKICDRDSDSVNLVDDCAECQEAIIECLAGYPKADEDEPIIEEDWDNVIL